MCNLACRHDQRACASCVQVLEFFYLLVGRGFAKQWRGFKHRRDVSASVGPSHTRCDLDLGHVLVLAWEEPREQTMSVNEVDYLGVLGRTVRLRDRLQRGEKWVIVWRLCGCSPAGM